MKVMEMPILIGTLRTIPKGRLRNKKTNKDHPNFKVWPEY